MVMGRQQVLEVGSARLVEVGNRTSLWLRSIRSHGTLVSAGCPEPTGQAADIAELGLR